MTQQLELICPQPGPQTLLLACPCTEIFFGGARGGGKTYGILLDWAAHAARYGDKAQGILFRRTMPEFEDILAKSRRIFPQLGYAFNGSNRTWTSPDGAVLRMRYLDSDNDADNYQGHEYTWLGFDELPNWPNSAPINKLRACLRSPYGVPVRMVATGNPGGVGHEWVKERYIDSAKPLTPHLDKETGHEIVYVPSKLQDNKLLMENDPTYALRLRGVGASWLVKAWLDGDWVISREGNIFRREHFQYYDVPPSDIYFIMQSWDTAFKLKEINSRSACTTWGAGEAGYYLLNGWAKHVEFPDLKKMVIELAVQWQPHQVCIEDKASGQSLIQELRRNTALPIKPIQVDQDKIARANSVTPLFEAKRIFLPSPKSQLAGPWLQDYIEELTAFPVSEQDRNGKITKIYHDDYVDSTTMALDRISHRPGAIRRLLANIYSPPPLRPVAIFAR